MRLPLRELSAYFLAFGVCCLAVPARADAGEETALGKLAAGMAPGQWRELKTEGYVQETLMRGDDILAYAGRAAWDNKAQQVLFIGQVHLKGPPVFIAYSLKDNRWQRLPTPKWAETLKWFHAYENNAADSGAGIFYHHASASHRIHKYDSASATWSIAGISTSWA